MFGGGYGGIQRLTEYPARNWPELLNSLQFVLTASLSVGKVSATAEPPMLRIMGSHPLFLSSSPLCRHKHIYGSYGPILIGYTMVYGSEPAKGNCKIIINIIQRTQGKKKLGAN